MKKILLIDDDKNIVTTLKIHLEERGMEVLIADSGRDGVALFKSMSPDVVFLDLRLPAVSYTHLTLPTNREV